MHLHTTSRAAGALAVTAVAAILTVTPAHARQDPGELLQDAGSNSASSRDGSVRQGTATVTVDDNAVEYLQVALGALGGIAVVGAIAAGSTRRHGHAHPA